MAWPRSAIDNALTPLDSLVARRGRPARAWLQGCAFGAILFVWSLTGGTWNLLSDRGLNIHDVQATALLNGHLSTPKGALSIEAFVVNGYEYSYFGPFPALLRMPVLWLAPHLVGKLSIMSLMAAFVVFSLGSAWLVSALVPNLTLDGLSERITMMALGFAASGGSVLTMAAAAPNHYHESLIWGLGLSLAALAATLRYLEQPDIRRLAVAALIATTAANARSTTGAAAALVLFLTVVWVWGQRRKSRPPLRIAPVHAALAATPAISIVVLNYLKFRMLLGLPMANQIFTKVNPHRAEMLQANGGKYFRPAFVPTNLVQYLRPDFVGFTAKFPFLQLPQRNLTNIGDLTYDQIDHTTSIWGASPAMAVWAAAGLALVLFRPNLRAALRNWSPPSPTKQRIVVSLVMAGVSVGGVAMIGFIGNRYLIDFMPLLIVGGLLGFSLWHRRPRLTAVVAAVTVTVCLALVGAAFSASVAFAQHGVALDNAVVQGHVHASIVAAANGVGSKPKVDAWNGFNPAGSAGDLLIVGDCEALYRSDGSKIDIVNRTNWRPIERSAAYGNVTFAVDGDLLDRLGRLLIQQSTSADTVDPEYGLILQRTTHGEDGDVTVYVNRSPGATATQTLRVTIVHSGRVVAAKDIVASAPFAMSILADRVLGLVEVRIGDKPLVWADVRIDRIELPAQENAWLRGVQLVDPPMDLCRSALGLAPEK